MFERLILPWKVLELIWADKEKRVAWREWGWEVDGPVWWWWHKWELGSWATFSSLSHEVPHPT